MNRIVRTGPLTRTQFAFWYGYLETPPQYRRTSHLTCLVDLPPGTSSATVADAVHLVRDRHEALRSTVRLGPDGEPLQEVRAAEHVALPHRALPEPAGPTELSGVLASLAEEPMELGEGQPVKSVLLTERGQPTHLCWVVPHVFSDAQSLDILREDTLKALVLARGRAKDEGLRLSPAGQILDTALAEQSEDHQRRNTASIRRWREKLASTPTTQFPYRRAPADQPARNRVVKLASTSVASTLPMVAKRFAVHGSSLALALFSALLGAYTGSRRWLWQVLADRRPRGDGDTIGCFISPALVDIGFAKSTTLSELAHGAGRDVLVGLRHGEYDYDGMVAASAEASARRGAGIELLTYFNYRQSPGESPRGETDVSTAPRGRISTSSGSPPTVLMASVSLGGDESGAGVFLEVSEDIMSESAQEAMVLSFERILLKAAADGDILLREIEDAARTDGWYAPPSWTRLSGDRWVDLDLTTHLLQQHPDVESLRLTVDSEGATDAELHARVGWRTTRAQHTGLDRHARALLGTPGFVLPDRFITDSVAAQPPRRDRHDQPDDAPWRAIHGAVQRVHGDRAVEPSMSYLAQGFSVRRLPAVHEHVRRAGWGGISFDDFLTPAPLESIARRLRRLH
ncbi:condensation domain-containing protein [Streptomyces aurantiacus]|uniref:Putative Surfactin synthase subunit 1 n=1 Tax=Streptomyces aurantiacus JA 4570 TaxID=1286094 RepID=S4A3E5_9ACTN|nr:condensation domain-containing protein [Streptomyces aurantiacus]EPH45235.1 putative Surfactin synthase subunit 1 [Streptomyces aurantiacus JA 4570]